MRIKNTRRMILLALLLSQALVLSIVEARLPIPIGVPGIKLGLANIITIQVIVFLGFREALLLIFLRTLLSSVFGGGLMIFIFSVTGGVLSTLVMTILYCKLLQFFSIAGISIAGAITHNVGQILVAILVTEEIGLISYLPALLVSGVIMGIFTGLLSKLLIHGLKKARLMEWMDGSIKF